MHERLLRSRDRRSFWKDLDDVGCPKEGVLAGESHPNCSRRGCIYLHHEELAALAPLALPRLAAAVTVVFRQSCWSVIATDVRDASGLGVGVLRLLILGVPQSDGKSLGFALTAYLSLRDNTVRSRV
jgi:hypothetical protein